MNYTKSSQLAAMDSYCQSKGSATNQSTNKNESPSFATVKYKSLLVIERVLKHWLPEGKLVDGGKEYTAPNPTRTDNHAGSFKVNLRKGTWCDFATGEKGGDLIDLVCYLEGGNKLDARNKLADFLCLTLGGAAKAGTSQISRKAKEPDWVPVTPIPDDAMHNVPQVHPQYGEPTKVWIYRNTESKPMLILHRFDPASDKDGKSQRKQFRPLTWCKHSVSGVEQWRWVGLRAPRPLYNLDVLVNRDSDPVVLSEGETDADAAAHLFPEHVATCWLNGADGVSNSDFSPLAGRDVLLWPDNDNDGTGLNAMLSVAVILRRLGARSVRLINLDVFSKRPIITDGAVAFEHGGKWPNKAGAADALMLGWTAAHLALVAQTGELFAPLAAIAEPPSKSSKPRNSHLEKTSTETPAQLPAGFRVTLDGVFYAGDDGEPRLVCSPLKILARTRDEKGQNWGLLVEFDDADGAHKRLNITARALTGDFRREVIGPLVDMGLRLAPIRTHRNTFNDLQSYLQGYESTERARIVTRLGWHGDGYLLPDRVIGHNVEHLHFYNAGSQLPPISQSGSLEQWQKQIGALCVGNPRLAFVVCAAFAGPLLHLLGIESGGFHLHGESSGGKTTHLQVAASVWGRPKFVRSWRSTDNALESIAAAHSDGLLVLDEIGMCDPRIIGETVYMLANGVGKERANDRGQAGRPVQEWRLLFLSTGEKTLEQHMSEAHKKLKAGMEVRLLALPADAGKGMGLFESLHNFDDAAALSDALKARVGKFYGSPAIAYLQALCETGKLREYVSVVRNTLEVFASNALPPSASGQSQRAAARFGLTAAAGELATTLGITGWPAGTALDAGRVCLDAWLAERGGTGNLEGDAIVARLRLVVERYGESRFSSWDGIAAKKDNHASRTTDRLGFRRRVERSPSNETSTTYYFLPTTWSQEVFRSMNLRSVNRELISRGILVASTDGKASQVASLPEMGSSRVYVVKQQALFSDLTEGLTDGSA